MYMYSLMEGKHIMANSNNSVYVCMFQVRKLFYKQDINELGKFGEKNKFSIRFLHTIIYYWKAGLDCKQNSSRHTCNRMLNW